jgi:hypothetical protein
MWRILAVLMVLMVLTLTGCAKSQFKISPEQYRQQVKTLGVLPLLVDRQSTIIHPEREAILDLLERHGADKERWLVEILRSQKNYFDVREVAGDPRVLFQRLVAGNQVLGQGDQLHRRYLFHPGAVTELSQRNSVDGLLVVIVNGIVRNEKRWDRDRTSLNFLQTDYNLVTASAAVVMPPEAVVWEHADVPGTAFLDLQYADFDEAFFNRNEQVQLRFVSLAGLDRTLSKRDTSMFFKSSLSQRYKDLFERLAAALRPGLLTQFGRSGTDTPPPR